MGMGRWQCWGGPALSLCSPERTVGSDCLPSLKAPFTCCKHTAHFILQHLSKCHESVEEIENFNVKPQATRCHCSPDPWLPCQLLIRLTSAQHRSRERGHCSQEGSWCSPKDDSHKTKSKFIPQQCTDPAYLHAHHKPSTLGSAQRANSQ